MSLRSYNDQIDYEDWRFRQSDLRRHAVALEQVIMVMCELGLAAVAAEIIKEIEGERR